MGKTAASTRSATRWVLKASLALLLLGASAGSSAAAPDAQPPEILEFTGAPSVKLPPEDRALLILAASAPSRAVQDNEMRLAQRLASALTADDRYRVLGITNATSTALINFLSAQSTLGRTGHSKFGKWWWWRTDIGSELLLGITNPTTLRLVDTLQAPNLWAGPPDRLVFQASPAVAMPLAGRALLVLAGLPSDWNNRHSEIQLAQKLAAALTQENAYLGASVMGDETSQALLQQLRDLEDRGLVSHDEANKHQWWRTVAGNARIAVGSTDTAIQGILDRLK